MFKRTWLSLLSATALSAGMIPAMTNADDVRVTTRPAVLQTAARDGNSATVQTVGWGVRVGRGRVSVGRGGRNWGGGYYGGGYRSGLGGGYRGGWGGYRSYARPYYGGYYTYPRYYYPNYGGYYYTTPYSYWYYY